MKKSGVNEITIEEIQTIELNIMKDIFKFCAQNDLKIFLDSGTLLGAIRNGGFIPWDNDADLIMPREDYEKFRLTYKSSEPYRLVNDDYPNSYLKVYDSRTILHEDLLRGKECIGVYTDIFPLDVLPEKRYQQDQYFWVMRNLSRLARIRSAKNNNPHGPIFRLIRSAIYILSLIIPEKKLYKVINLYAQRYSWMDSTLCTQMVCAVKSKKILKKSWFDGQRVIDFIGEKFPIPIEAEEYLTELYGKDFIIPPSEDEIEVHFYHAAWINK